MNTGKYDKCPLSLYSKSQNKYSRSWDSYSVFVDRQTKLIFIEFGRVCNVL